LVKKNYKNGRLGRIWPIYYRITSQFLQGGTICPNKNAIKAGLTSKKPTYHCLSLPVPNSDCADFNHFDADRSCKKMRDSRGNLLKVSTKVLFGKKKEIEKRIQKLGIGQKINTSHMRWRCI